ncbi:MAG: hypothetical protein WBP29_03750 [Candidatus Zixiibacteriota bacterium]
MNNWDDLFSQIRADRQLGAAQLYAQTLNILKKTAATGAVKTHADIVDIVQAIHDTQPAMAPFHFLAQKLSCLLNDQSASSDLSKVLLALVNDLDRAHQSTGERIALQFDHLNLSPKSVMLHSSSGTVRELVRQSIPSDATIFISEGRPDMEGLSLAGELVIEGFAVKTFVDDARAQIMKDVDIIILGSDWISEHDFTNKIGTYTLALTARELGKRIFVAADSTKFAPARFRPDPKKIVRHFESFYQDLLFEQTPNSLITAFVTDSGVLLPKEVEFHFETARV